MTVASLFATDAARDSRVAELLGKLLSSLYAEDEAELFLRGAWLSPVAELSEVIRYHIRNLSRLLDPETIPERFLAYLASTVGIDPALFGGRTPTALQWRRLIRMAAEGWKAKGSQTNYRRVVRALTGERAFVGDWHGYSEVLGETPLGFAWTGAFGSNEEYETDIWVADLPSGTVDYTQLSYGLDMYRPAHERLNLIQCAFVEDWSDGVDQWVNVSGTSLDATAMTMAIFGALLRLNRGHTPFDWTHYRMQIICSFYATSMAKVYLYYTGDTSDCYRIEITPGAGSTIKLFKGVTQIGATRYPPTLMPSYGYRFDFECLDVGSGTTRIRVIHEGVEILSETDTAYTQGSIAFETDFGKRFDLHLVRLAEYNNTSNTRIGPA